MIRIAIIEDRTLIREALASLLGANGSIEVVAQTARIDDVAQMARDQRLDVLVVGSAIDGGTDVVRTLSSAGLPTRVLFVGTGRSVSPPRLMATGAAGYISGDATGRELASAIARVHGGERVTPVATNGHDPVAVLSPRELETLRFLACGMTNREIATRLGISVKTIDTHRGHVLKKLNLRNNADLTRFAIEYGLCELEPESPSLSGDANAVARH
jgi:DNA-binding NarL/FixJ family response regulator